MIALRITGYGPAYDVEIPCGSCHQKGKYTFNLADLPIKRLAIDPVAKGENVFETRLPISGKIVKFKFLTGADEENILAAQEKMKKIVQGVETLITTKLKSCIVALDGNTDRLFIDRFVGTMPARDSLYLRKYIDHNEPGVEMKVEFTCNNIDCGHSEEVALPLGPSFFWPEG
jgi:hypothetical protein